MTAGIQQEQIGYGKELANNLLVNPGFEIWQRGVGPFTADNAWVADEWQLDSLQGGESHSCERESTNKKFGTYSVKYTGTDIENGGGVQQGIEHYKSLEGLWLTFSVWVKTTKSDVHLHIVDYDGSLDTVASADHSGGGDWEQLTVTKQIRTGLTTYAGHPHSFGLRVGCTFPSGTGTFYADGASLVVGEYRSGVDFLPLNPAEDMQRCERFYQTEGVFALGFSGNAVNGVTYYAFSSFHTAMYAIPTITLTDGGASGFPAVPGVVSVSNKTIREARVCNDALSSDYFSSAWKAEVT